MKKTSELQNDIKELLLNAKNVILTGAPGTGKTYMAKDIAAKIITGDDTKTYSDIENNEELRKQICFVQFHPSYDYTDFVEGLRPNGTVRPDGQIVFERVDGVFKEFCKRAAKNYRISKLTPQQQRDSNSLKDDFRLFIASKMVDSKGNISPDIKMKTKSGKEFTLIGLDEYAEKVLFDSETNKTYNSFPFYRFEQLYEKREGKKVDNVKDVKDFFGYKVSSSQFSYLLSVYNDFVKYKKGRKENVGVGQTLNNGGIEDEKKFVFIIDEINRGEISKIFGELFYCIDPGYRGEKGRIKTQYQNLIEDGDEFKEGFYVSDNVYIIGTMNDIDRSVESMDFALRRRFAFREIKAEETQSMLDVILSGDKILVEAKERMGHINDQISKTDGLNESYHIGASYFGNLKRYKQDGDNAKRFEKLWNYNIEPLIKEYLRGIDDDSEKFKKIRAAYYSLQADSSESWDDI